MRDDPEVRFISRKWPPAVGGMETYSARIASEFGKRVRVDVIALRGKPSGKPPSVFAFPGFALRAVVRLITSPPSRVVHITDLASWPLAWCAKLRSSASRIVISAHGSDVSVAFRRGLLARCYRTYLRAGARLLRASRIIANSDYVADLSRRAGFRDVSVVPLATDMRRTASANRSGLLYAGRISARKGLRFIVEDVLPKLPTGTRIRVAGTVWEESERELLSHEAVDYLGTLQPDDLATEYGRAAVVVVPTSESEGFGLVAIEAAACGTFVVASAHSALVDVVRPPIGVVVPAADSAAWASAIRAALSRSADEQGAQAKAAQRLVDSDYRWHRVADSTWAIYNKD